MPYTKETLQNMYSLSSEDVLATLIACGLTDDTQEYSDAEIETRFDIVRQWFNSGQVSDYQEATTLFQKRLEDNSAPSTRNEKKSRKKSPLTLDITELLIAAREQGLKLTLTQASRILAFCGLTDKEEYTQQEVERFIQASGFVGEETPDISSSIEDISTESESALAGLVDRVTDYLAEKIPTGLVKDLYVQKAIAKLGQQSQGSDHLFAQLEDKIIQQLEGKSQTQTPLQQLQQKHRVFSLPPTSIKLVELPSESESDTTTS
jgi:hypothetical protein